MLPSNRGGAGNWCFCHFTRFYQTVLIELLVLLANWNVGLSPFLIMVSNLKFSPLAPLQDCVEHINRIARVLAQPRGNLLLVGVGGSGRSSCAKICGLAIAEGWVPGRIFGKLGEWMGMGF